MITPEVFAVAAGAASALIAIAGILYGQLPDKVREEEEKNPAPPLDPLLEEFAALELTVRRRECDARQRECGEQGHRPDRIVPPPIHIFGQAQALYCATSYFCSSCGATLTEAEHATYLGRLNRAERTFQAELTALRGRQP